VEFKKWIKANSASSEGGSSCSKQYSIQKLAFLTPGSKVRQPPTRLGAVPNHPAHGINIWGEIGITESPGRLAGNSLGTACHTDHIKVLKAFDQMLSQLSVFKPNVIMHKQKDFVRVKISLSLGIDHFIVNDTESISIGKFDHRSKADG
jgi:hypothetical protein